MLTETEILDEQTQSLDQVLEKLENHETEVVTPNVVPDVAAGEAVQITVECMRAAVDLYHTISQEGVSADDVKALQHIRQRMSPYVTLSYKPALEAYVGMFTPNRTMINQVVSQEATMAEIGLTLKEWFYKFIDFIIKVVEWCRIAWNSETAVNGRLRVIDHNLQSMYNSFEYVFKRNQSNGREYAGELNAIWKQVLLDPKLSRTDAMLYAFGVTDNAGVYIDSGKVVDEAYRWIIMDINGLKSRLEKSVPMELGHDYAGDVSDAAAAMEALTVASTDVDFLVDALPKDYWRKPKIILARKAFVPSHNIEQVQAVAKKLRDIRRNGNFDDLKDTDAMVRSIENITGTIKGIERVITVKQNLFIDFYKASATLTNFYIRGHAMLLDEMRKYDDEDTAKVVIEKLSKSWENICAKMGI